MDIFKKTPSGDFSVLANAKNDRFRKGLESFLKDASNTRRSNFASAFYSQALIEGLVQYLSFRLKSDSQLIKEKYTRALFPKAPPGSVVYFPETSNKPELAFPVNCKDAVECYDPVRTEEWSKEINNKKNAPGADKGQMRVIGPKERQFVFGLPLLNKTVHLSSFLDVDRPTNPQKIQRHHTNRSSVEDLNGNFWIAENCMEDDVLVYKECFPNSSSKCKIERDLITIKGCGSSFDKKAVKSMVSLFLNHPKYCRPDDFNGIWASTTERNNYCHNHILAVTEIDKYNQRKGALKNGRKNRWFKHSDLAQLIEFVKSLD